MNSMKLRLGAKNGTRRGALSLEMMGVIAIIGILVMGGLYYLSIMMRDSKVNSAISSMQLINTKVNEMFVNESDFSELTVARFISSGNAPSSLLTSDKTGLESPWGSMTLWPANSSPGATNDTFAITFQSIPEDVCQRLASVVRGSGTWQSVSIGGTTFDVVDNEGDSFLDFTDNCKAGANEMIFKAKRQ